MNERNSWTANWKFWDKPVDAMSIWKQRVKVLGETPSLGLEKYPDIGEGYLVTHPDTSTPYTVSGLHKSAVIFPKPDGR